MIYVPAPPPSEKAHELGRKLAEVIRNFMRENPGISALEIRQAFRLALTEIGIKSQAASIALVIGLVLLGLVSLLFFGRGLRIENPSMILGVVVLIAVIALGISFLRRNQ
jgi:hypothetical protein